MDEQGLDDLLDAVRRLRTTLAIDLSAAAGALDDGRPEIARDILAATSAEITSADQQADHAEPVGARTRARHRRVLLALPVVPLVGAIAMTAAAAIGGISASGSHHRHDAAAVTAAHRPVTTTQLATTTTPVASHGSAATTLHRLEHVVQHHERASQVLAVADDLHQQLTAMIATSTNDPARLHVVRQLLILEQRVLKSSKLPGTQVALAASREIARLLELGDTTDHDGRSSSTQVAPRATPSPRPTGATAPVTTSSRHEQPTATTHAATTRTPTSLPSDTLFGRGVFGRH